jgi:NAD(P)-dependent dehydrogenase (short-subunit alcohol dehydrogenase family)
MKMKRVALVTGANRGLGLETCKQLARQNHTVVLTSRDESKGRAAAAELAKEGSEVHFHKLDVTSAESIKQIKIYLEKEFKRLDVLINNAGILPHGPRNNSTFDAEINSIREAMETNVFGPFQLCQQLIPLMRKNGYGRVVNLSSGMGQLSEMNAGYPAYRISKTALNAVTRIYSEETNGENILVNSVCPGWVKTDMGGEEAERELPEGADTIVWLATLPDGSPTGGFFRDRQPIAW